MNVSAEGLEKTMKEFFGNLPKETQLKLWSKYFGNGSDGVDSGVIGRAIGHGSREFMDKLRTGKLDRSYQEEARVTAILDRHFYETQTQQNLEKALKLEGMPKNGVKKLAEPNWEIIGGVSAEDVTNYGLASEESDVNDMKEDTEVAANNTSQIPEGSEKDSKFKRSEMNMDDGGQRVYDDTNVLPFHEQEMERYNNPTNPFIYKLLTGEPRWVAPVCKKTLDANVRPRDHFLLIPERPSAVTILSLVRDAAAKLPQGFGTRSDICDLLKESQFINLSTDEEKMSSVVSGALDRLHYESDPCVRYDSARKLWIYLHWPKEFSLQNGFEGEEGGSLIGDAAKGKRVKSN